MTFPTGYGRGPTPIATHKKATPVHAHSGPGTPNKPAPAAPAHVPPPGTGSNPVDHTVLSPLGSSGSGGLGALIDSLIQSFGGLFGGTGSGNGVQGIAKSIQGDISQAGKLVNSIANSITPSL